MQVRFPEASKQAGIFLLLLGSGHTFSIGEEAQQRLQALGLDTLEKMRAVPGLQLHRMLFPDNEMNSGVFNICCDGYVLPKPLGRCILDGDYQDIDYMLGSTHNEGGKAA